jgi:signal peptidase I
VRKLGRALFRIALALAAFVAIAWLTAIDAWTLPDDPRLAASVAPTLHAGDTVLILRRGTPGFGDLVRCADPEEPSRFVVARIAGLPNDTVETDGVELVVNGKRYNSQSACPPDLDTVVEHPNTHATIPLHCDQVEMGGGWHYRGYASRDTFNARPPITVREDHVYLLSDNRSHHDDSRDFKTLPRASCKGRVFFRLWGRGGWADDKSRLSYIH